MHSLENMVGFCGAEHLRLALMPITKFKRQFKHVTVPMFSWVPKVPALGQRKLAEEVPPALGAGALWIVMVRWILRAQIVNIAVAW